MTHCRFALVVLSAVGLPAYAHSVSAASPGLTERSIQDAGFVALPEKPEQRPLAEIVKAEVLLSRAHVSPGEIDGIDGDNFRKAITIYQGQMSLPASGRLDQATWTALSANSVPPLTRYEITRTDVKGPFTASIPVDFHAQSRLHRLGYHDIKEALAERFHMSVPLLVALNPGHRFAAGQRITVAAVADPKRADKATRVVVDKAGHTVQALASDGRLLASYLASIGSAEKPAPTGDFTIRRIVHNPDYTYFPRFAFAGVKSKTTFTIAPGPNNPVGAVWMDLSFDGYGIHGTPSPGTVGKTQSHGCIRLTNWDALDLASLIDKDTPVSFGDVPGSAGPVAPAAPVAPATDLPASHPKTAAKPAS